MTTIMMSFLAREEGFASTGYVPNLSVGSHTSGVTVGMGVDLGNFGNLDVLDLPKDLRKKLKPYEGLRGREAAEAIQELPLRLTEEEAILVSEGAKDYIEGRIARAFNRDSKDKNWQDLPEEIQTSILSVAFNHGTNVSRYPKFWGKVTSQDWEGAVNELRSFYSNKEHSLLPRRNREANLIEEVLVGRGLETPDEGDSFEPRQIPPYRMMSSLGDATGPTGQPWQGSLEELERAIMNAHKRN